MKLLSAAACILVVSPLFAILPAAGQDLPSAVGVVTAPPGRQTGRDFAESVMMDNMFEFEASKLALESAHSPAVRQFAAEMVDAHRSMAAQFKPVLDGTMTGLEVTPPPAFDPQHRDMFSALQAADGPAFDALYMAEQASENRHLLAVYRGYARHGMVKPLREFAREMVPVVRGHIASLQELDNGA